MKHVITLEHAEKIEFLGKGGKLMPRLWGTSLFYKREFAPDGIHINQFGQNILAGMHPLPEDTKVGIEMKDDGKIVKHAYFCDKDGKQLSMSNGIATNRFGTIKLKKKADLIP